MKNETPEMEIVSFKVKLYFMERESLFHKFKCYHEGELIIDDEIVCKHSLINPGGFESAGDIAIKREVKDLIGKNENFFESHYCLDSEGMSAMLIYVKAVIERMDTGAINERIYTFRPDFIRSIREKK